MTDSVLEFDEIAADDALIEAIRSGVTATDVPADDPAASVLIALRDGADLPVTVPGSDVAALGGLVRRGRLVASGVAACVLVLAGVGTAVAGDPSAAFRFMFHQGVELGSRFGTPAGDDRAQAPLGGGFEARGVAPRNSPPVRQGSAAAPWLSDGTREPSLGYQQEHQDWTQPDDQDLLPESLDDKSAGDVGGSDGHAQPNDSPPTESTGPGQDDQTTPPDDGYGPQSTDPTTPEDEPTTTDTSPTTPETATPTPTPTLTSPTPTETSPTSPAPTSPTETSPTPTEPTPTETSTPSSQTPTPSPPASNPSPTES